MLLAVCTGFEPVVSSVTGRHVNRYTNTPVGASGGNSTTRQQVTELVETLDFSSIATTYPDTAGLLHIP